MTRGSSTSTRRCSPEPGTSSPVPTFITVGDGDPFASQGQELADALAARGVEVATRFWDGSALGLPHEYQFDLDLPASQTTLAQVIGFLAEHTGETAGDAS